MSLEPLGRVRRPWLLREGAEGGGVKWPLCVPLITFIQPLGEPGTVPSWERGRRCWRSSRAGQELGTDPRAAQGQKQGLEKVKGWWQGQGREWDRGRDRDGTGNGTGTGTGNGAGAGKGIGRGVGAGTGAGKGQDRGGDGTGTGRDKGRDRDRGWDRDGSEEG